ncbi:MAG: hypothetical protein IPO56_14495 [Flavobacteriales bacterium]|nr:hypothetical protein [Flavobacteriales bacterium]MBK8708718.1 hypothetical protein [Flavobacteriales bacterium]MBK9628859.1 hypothetical protein [Flavobacteriales bacterium]
MDPNLTGNILVAIVSTLLGGAVAIIAQVQIRRLYRTRLEQTHDNIYTPDGETLDDGIFATYHRIRLFNAGNETAKSVRPYLVHMDILNTKTQKWVRLFDSTMDLCWSYRGPIGAVDIPAKTPLFFDVLKVRSDSGVFIPQTIVQPKVWIDQLAKPGRYRMGFVISCENIKAPLEGQLEFDWNGDWKGVECHHLKTLSE